MDKELEDFVEEGNRRLARLPPGTCRWNTDGGRMVFFDMELLLRPDGTGKYAGYGGKTTYEGKFRWEVVSDFLIRVQPDGHETWYNIRYDVTARRSYDRMIWVINWHSLPRENHGLHGFSEEEGMDFVPAAPVPANNAIEGATPQEPQINWGIVILPLILAAGPVLCAFCSFSFGYGGMAVAFLSLLSGCLASPIALILAGRNDGIYRQNRVAGALSVISVFIAAGTICYEIWRMKWQWD